MKVRNWLEKFPERFATAIAVFIGYRFNFRMTYLSMEFWLKLIDCKWVTIEGIDRHQVLSCGDYLELIDDNCFWVWQVRELYSDYVLSLKVEYERWALSDFAVQDGGKGWMSDECVRLILTRIDSKGLDCIESFIIDRHGFEDEIKETYNDAMGLIEDYMFYVTDWMADGTPRYSSLEECEMNPDDVAATVNQLRDLYVWNRMITISKVLGVVVVVVVVVSLVLGGN